jgi:hypothetical protein
MRPTDRDGAGQFRPGAPILDERTQLPRADPRPQHYYELLEELGGRHLFIPTLWDAKEPTPAGQRRCDRLWQRHQSMRWNLDHLMDTVAGLMDAKACGFYNHVMKKWTPFNPPRGTFKHPLLLGCMRLLRHKVKATKHVYMDKSGYVQLTLYREGGRQVRIGAHHFMLWAVHGMPPSQMHTQAMHCCPGHEEPCCVAPRHLAWATPSQNAQDYRRRVEEGSRSAPRHRRRRY